MWLKLVLQPWQVKRVSPVKIADVSQQTKNKFFFFGPVKLHHCLQQSLVCSIVRSKISHESSSITIPIRCTMREHFQMCNLILLFIPLGNDKQGKERFDNCHALGTKISPLLTMPVSFFQSHGWFVQRDISVHWREKMNPSYRFPNLFHRYIFCILNYGSENMQINQTFASTFFSLGWFYIEI